MIKQIFSCFFILLLIAACTTSTSRKSISTKQNNNYKKTGNSIHPEFTLFNVNDSITELHFKISSKEILYSRPDGIDFVSNIMISYTLHTSYDSREIIDSSSTRLVDLNNALEEKYIIGKINVNAQSPKIYYLRVQVKDLNRNIISSTTLRLDKSNDLSRQNFIVKDKVTDAPIFGDIVGTSQQLIIQYKSKVGANLFVRYYNRNFPLSAPPFSLIEPKPFQYQSDSAFTMQFAANGTVNFTVPKIGFYHFQLDTTKKDGLTLYNFYDDYPLIKKAEEMIYPLRYISTTQEYDGLMADSNKKAAIDKFWLNATGSPDRGREVIRKFYNRVQDANRYFSSFVEGWKTDRGMVYLIYGSPNVIYRTANSETWVYGEENNINSLSYSFTKLNNPFSDNDYMLERSVVYKQSWYTAVDIWRQGRTYLQD